MSIAEKVEGKMKALEHLMITQMHIESPSVVAESIEGLSMYWAHIPDSDKDYIDCAREALKNKTEWVV